MNYLTDMTEQTENQTEITVIDAAITAFVRFGVRKTSMNDIARFAGVSRQTLYDLFGNKDALIRAAILRTTDIALQAIDARLPSSGGLADTLDIYLDETVRMSFDLLQTAADPEDLISGHNAAGAEAIKESHVRQKQFLEDELRQAMPDADPGAVIQLANFTVTVAMGFKYIDDRDELETLLESLKKSVLAVANSA